jgi:hypothetical protein
MEKESILLRDDDSKAEEGPVILADSLRMIFLTLAIVAQVVMLRKLTPLLLCHQSA